MLKKKLNIFSILFGLILFSILTYIFYKNASKNLSEYSQVESFVIEKGITKSENNNAIFYLKIPDYQKRFSIYLMTRNYDEFENKINIGDKVKIHFKNLNSEKNKYLDVIQLEKENQVLVNHKKHKLIYYGLSILCLLANTYILFMLFHYIKYRNFDNPIPTIF
ncbi:hypothetical protein NAL32_19910 [Chryseobacterium sp. Ch-15]|uniref:DUF3592 domain-containing protein n=1 Tax=Chryseobacterium muglaense TaxID=2893752 RepID=A0A9Q3UTH4_9FLAO|nr:hypothetical protein [Chryseobacterium muglaense]MBD3906932.1 hypothetical protein [Chryseobacterium muglaense]MCC9033738.1 hypothetical protein [Chryseobacterium muglaense]MCM2556662.1 hypothetical protein [Chryseobacterium muglaense]